MSEDCYNILQIFKEQSDKLDINGILSSVISDLKSSLLTFQDSILLDLIFSKNPTQDKLDNCLKNYDIEITGGHKALMLAYFMKMNPSLKYSDYVLPRLKGLLQFYRFQNLKLISHYNKIGKNLNKANIDFIIFKGGCIKHLRPDFPRVMGDIDILVREKDFIKCSEIVSKMGYDISYDIHSIDLHPKNSEEGIMDIHKYILLDSDKEKIFLDDLFKRATFQQVFGVSTLVPSNEDLFFISLVNLARNLKNNTSANGILYNLFDCKFLIESKPDFDINIVMNNAKKTKTQAHISFALQFLNSIIPNLFDDYAQDKRLQKELKNYIILFIYQRYFLLNMKEKSHKMKIKNLFSGYDFFMEYLKFKPKYLIEKNKFVRNNPLLAQIILKNYYDNITKRKT